MRLCALALLLLAAFQPCCAQEAENEPPAARLARTIVQQLAAGEFDKVEARYTPEMSAALPSGRLAATWAAVLEQTGSFNSIASVTVSGKADVFDIVLVACKFDKVEIDARVALSPDGHLAGLRFLSHQEPAPPWTPPAYVKPDSFTEDPLALVDGAFQLPGALTLPKGNGPFPAVVLVQGSGPHDEDETIAANKPFKDLAWGLASRNIAVFRYVKRTQRYGAHSSEDPAKLTVNDETIDDARVAVALLAKQKKIDARRIFVLGHSLGGYLAPRIASGDAQIAGIVVLAGNVQPVEQLLLDQVRYVMKSLPAPTAQDQSQVASVEQVVKRIESPDLKPGETVVLLSSSTPASYWIDLRNYRPVEVAKTLTIPMLFLQGGRDFQVPPDANFEEWKAALSNRPNVSLKFYPSLNHLFIAGTGPSLPQEYEKPGHVEEQVVADIAAWISATGKSPR